MAIWEKLFSKITFKNYPDTSTPINADNLNKMTDAIDGIDDRVVELNSNLTDRLGGAWVHSGITTSLTVLTSGIYTINNYDGKLDAPWGGAFGLLVSRVADHIYHLAFTENRGVALRDCEGGVWSEWEELVKVSSLKNYNRPTNFIGYSNDVPTETWVKTSCDIVVDTTGDYMVNFPFLRNQGGNDISFNNYIVITDEDTLPNDYEAQMGSVTRNWGISSCSRCFRFNANTPYHIFVKHTASVAHTIDFYGYIFKLSEI
jgi:hypothetical protein